MCRNEFFDITDSGWIVPEGKMVSEWFADSYEDAIEFEQKMGHGVDSEFYVIEVDIPENIVKKLYRVSGNHDVIEPV